MKRGSPVVSVEERPSSDYQSNLIELSMSRLLRKNGFVHGIFCKLITHDFLPDYLLKLHKVFKIPVNKISYFTNNLELKQTNLHLIGNF